MKKLLSISVVSILLDQILKLIITSNIDLNTSIKVINNFFYITNVNNYGAAWSILNGNRLFLIIIGITTLIFLYIIFLKNKKLNKSEIITYGLLIGGIIGNLIDRIIYGYVIDYLDFYILNYDYPVFNFADICIVISIISLIYLTLKGGVYDNSK